jgi:hypothetical protein
MGRLPRLVLCYLMSVSFVLMPYSTLHAHLSDHDQVHVHAGHVHDLDHHGDTRSLDQVVNVSVSAAASSSPGHDFVIWLPVLCAVALLALALPFLTSILRPPSRDTEPIPRRSHRQPPLRGPPSVSIQAL